MIDRSDERTCELSEAPFTRKEKVEIDKTINKLLHDFRAKELITYLPFSHCSIIFRGPSPEKEKVIQKLFPQIPTKNIHEWLTEGSALASTIFERSWEEGKKRGGFKARPNQ
jgi:hypothetical protein